MAFSAVKQIHPHLNTQTLAHFEDLIGQIADCQVVPRDLIKQTRCLRARQT